MDYKPCKHCGTKRKGEWAKTFHALSKETLAYKHGMCHCCGMKLESHCPKCDKKDKTIAQLKSKLDNAEES